MWQAIPTIPDIQAITHDETVTIQILGWVIMAGLAIASIMFTVLWRAYQMQIEQARAMDKEYLQTLEKNVVVLELIQGNVSNITPEIRQQIVETENRLLNQIQNIKRRDHEQ